MPCWYFTADHQLQHLVRSPVVHQLYTEAELVEVRVQTRSILVGSAALVHSCLWIECPVIDDNHSATFVMLHAVPIFSLVIDSCSACRGTAKTHPTHINQSVMLTDVGTVCCCVRIHHRHRHHHHHTHITFISRNRAYTVQNSKQRWPKRCTLTAKILYTHWNENASKFKRLMLLLQLTRHTLFFSH